MSTSARNPSRWLAPLALLACAIAVFAIVSGGSSGTSSNGTATPSRPASSSKATQKQSGAKKRRSGGARTYRVQPGDTLSAIAAKTGVPLTRIEQLNPSLDSQALQTGQKVKLGP
jgi:LysM repeat protein